MPKASVNRLPHKLVVDLGLEPKGKVRSVNIDCAVDLNESGEVMAIEIINFVYHLGERVLEGYEWPSVNLSSEIRASFDKEVDAFYLKFGAGPSVNQRPVIARAILDAEGHLIRFEIPLT